MQRGGTPSAFVFRQDYDDFDDYDDFISFIYWYMIYF